MKMKFQVWSPVLREQCEKGLRKTTLLQARNNKQGKYTKVRIKKASPLRLI